LFLYYAHKRLDGVGYLLLFSFILSYVTFQQFNFSCQIIMEEIQENELINQVIKITTTGKVELDQGMLKPIKKACKHNEAFLKPVFDTIMKQLKRKHSEIRLSAFQTLKELFERSHQFRLLVLEDLYTILELTLETNNVLLPPPKAAAKRLRTLASETLQLPATSQKGLFQ